MLKKAKQLASQEFSRLAGRGNQRRRLLCSLV
ncbi:Uncharacterised protein [Streptococcus pneumoniae]|nr:Uncharacterised protein [Streptococcus pneumoniae]